MASAVCEAVRKISIMAYPEELEDLTFSEISDIIKKKVATKKKLVIAERTKYLVIKVESTKTIIHYTQVMRGLQILQV